MKALNVTILALGLTVSLNANAGKPVDAGSKGAEKKAEAQVKRDCIKQSVDDLKSFIVAARDACKGGNSETDECTAARTDFETARELHKDNIKSCVKPTV